MRRRILPSSFLLLVIAGLPTGPVSVSQTLTKCIARSKPLIVPKGKPLKLTSTVPGRSTIEYHVKPKTDMNVNIRIANSQLKLDIYSLGPSTLVKKSVDNWPGQFSGGKEYVLVVNNCSGNSASKFQLQITSN